MMNKLISIVVPVYNVEAYLEQCVDSVLNQTYRNIEVILVDDGSPDNCPRMCDEYAKKDHRVKVIHKTNGGLSDARNAGVRIATGDYIGFVDSDDWIDADMYETLLKLAEDTGAQIAEIGVKFCYPEKTVFQKSEKTGIFDKKNALGAFLDRSMLIQGCVWGKLYIADIPRKIPFPVGRLHEDGFFTYKALYEADTYALSDACKYNYRQGRPGSIMASRSKAKNYYDVIDAFEERNRFFEERHEEALLGKSKAYYYKTLVSYLRSSVRDFGENSEVRIFLAQRINSQHRDILKSPNPRAWKLKYVVFRVLNPHLFRT